jgi:hypothetical protein
MTPIPAPAWSVTFALFAMPRTLTARGNAEDPVARGRQGPVRIGAYAAVVLLLEELPALDEELEAELDEPESEDDEPEDPELDDFAAAGELLDEEPRLSFR